MPAIIVNGTPGNDTLVVTATSPDSEGSLIINGTAGADTLTVNGDGVADFEVRVNGALFAGDVIL
jgi:hypothetical protein